MYESTVGGKIDPSAIWTRIRLELAIMAIGERIHFIRNLRGMTQKYLGILAGFPERTADVRMAQYESGTRTPKADFLNF